MRGPRAGLALALALAATTSVGAPWRFGEPVPVSPHHGEGVFHHLESAGRRNLAVDAGTAGVAWEDNHTGTSQVYVAFATGDGGFDAPRRVSRSRPAYEPAIAALGEGAFAVVWEEADAVWLRRVARDGMGPARRLAAPARQASIDARGGRAHAVWGSRRGEHARIMAAPVRVTEGGMEAGAAAAVDGDPPAADQLYPSVVLTAAGVVVGWEDRRAGHTRIYTSFAPRGEAFGAARPLNDLPPPISAQYGAGTGAARVALARAGVRRVAAAWMDKRDFRGGYDIYAALSGEGGARFGPNELVQDMFGSTIAQWHPALAAGPGGRVAVVWDDDRDRTSDLWLSWRRPGGWSEDLAVPGASGAGEQSNPAIAIDADGDLHVAWLSQDEKHGPTRLWYVKGTVTSD